MMAVPGVSGQELPVVKFLEARLNKAGVSPELLKFDRAHKHSRLGGEIGNLVLRLPGTYRGPRRLFVAHMDTVPLCLGTRPVQRGNFIVAADKHTGLGADNRAGVAVLLSTVLILMKKKLPHPPLTFLWTVQEEAGLHGARHVQFGLLGKPRLAFNYDGGSPARLTIGATGGYRMLIDIQGVASHAGARPTEGVSAIAIASLATADLVQRGWHGAIQKGRREGTSNIGTIEGGIATNVVADSVQLRAEARSHDQEFLTRIVSEMEQAFHKAALRVSNANGKTGSVTINGQLDYESFRLPLDDPSVAAAHMAIEAEGLKPEVAIANGGLDANWLTARGIPTVSLGCGQEHIHTVNERLNLREFQRARRIALRLATGDET